MFTLRYSILLVYLKLFIAGADTLFSILCFRCTNLQELILTENFLTELPKSMGNLKELTVLNVDRNSLGEIPLEIGNMTLLGVLSLRDNKLTRLPNELGNCKSLHVLDVSGNR